LHLIKGLAFLGLLYLLVKLTGMEASEFLLSSLFQNALLILVVLFSPEIRNILERFGRRSITDFSFFSFKNDSAYQEAVTDLVNDFCKAAGEMSETKTGALVVFEREAPLNEVTKSGTILDARSSTELFNGIFFKNSALHDGAVVVKDAKIYAAGCILPLTQNNAISSDLGTRHRAAIGMSEQSDAVVVIVSEETGYISVAGNGKLQRDIKTSNLREILLSNLISNDDKKNKPRKKIRGGNSEK
jgi:diadenylate cyclase